MNQRHSTHRSTSEPRRWRDTGWPMLAIVVASLVGLVLLFGPLVAGSRRLVFRDISHFYRPLYQYIADRSQDQWLPLWNPLDRFGMPIVGEASTAMFYPPRALFLVPWGPETAWALYVLLHLAIAGGGAYRAARGAGASATASAIAAWAYPASGAVFFLYTNPPFLVGAAWLPWAIQGLLGCGQPLKSRAESLADSEEPTARGRGGVDRRAFLRRCSAAAVPLAMSILGGDPQTALHAVLMAVVVLAVAALLANPRCDWRAMSGIAARVAAACVLATGLALPQIWPAFEWSRQSWRRATAPPNVYASLLHEPPLVEEPTEGGHAADVYSYSLAPWHLTELASPLVSGHLAPVNTRASSVLPGEPRMWTPTIYCGAVALVMLLGGVPRRRMWNRWLGVAVLGLGMSFGVYGAGYVLRTLLYWMGSAVGDRWQDAFGGPYWMLVQFLPGYNQFRFPAKWLPVFALGTVVFAATRLSAIQTAEIRSLKRIAAALAGISLLTLGILSLPIVGERVMAVLGSESHPDALWGPLDANAVLREWRLSFIWTALAMGGIAAWAWRSASPNRQPWLAPLLGLTILEMLLLVHWQSVTVPVEPPSPSARQQEMARLAPAGENARSSEEVSARPPRRYLLTYDDQRPPRSWSTVSDSGRAASVDLWMRDAWFVRWHLSDRAAVTNNAVSITSERSERLWQSVNQRLQRGSAEQGRALLESLAERLAIVRVGRPSNDGALEELTPSAEREELDGLAGVEELAALRWHSRWQSVSPSQPSLRTTVDRLLDGLAQRGNDMPPLVEPTGSGGVVSGLEDRAGPDTRASADEEADARLLRWSPQEIHVAVTAAAPGLLTMMQENDGGWRAVVRSGPDDSWTPTSIHPTDVVGQGVFLPRGTSEVRWVYQPRWLWPSLVVSFLAAALVIGGAAGGFVSRRSEP